jgi:hypothetical protein
MGKCNTKKCRAIPEIVNGLVRPLKNTIPEF